MMNMKKFQVMMTLLNNFQMMKMCPILRMVFHPKIKKRLGWEILSVWERYNIPLEHDHSM